MLRYLKTVDGLDYYRFTPSLFKQYEACYSAEERPPYWKRPIHRIRMMIEHLSSRYFVIYVQKDGRPVGHHVVARGGGRLPVSTKEDLVIGPTWIVPSQRAHGYGGQSYGAVLRDLDLPFRYAYSFIDVDNAPSIAMVKKNGCVPIFRAKEYGLLKRIRETEGGNFLIFRYPGAN